MCALFKAEFQEEEEEVKASQYHNISLQGVHAGKPEYYLEPFYKAFVLHIRVMATIPPLKQYCFNVFGWLLVSTKTSKVAKNRFFCEF